MNYNSKSASAAKIFDDAEESVKKHKVFAPSVTEPTPFLASHADPFLTKHNGWYYFLASVAGYDRIEIRRSKKLNDLKDAKAKVVFFKHETGEMSEHIWAPELHYIFGKWYIYFAASKRDDKWELRPYVLECDSQDPFSGNWTEKGMMQAASGDVYSFTDFSLDATVFESCGKHYMVWAEKVGRRFGISNLYIAEMETATKLKTIQVLISTPDYDWERVDFWVNEGPAVLKRNGKIYLTYSASATGTMYCMGMLTANDGSDLLDPSSWTKERYPLLKSDTSKGFYGPGHNSFCTDDDGNDIIVFHSRTTDKILCEDPLYDYNRHTFISRVSYDKNNNPIFKLPD